MKKLRKFLALVLATVMMMVMSVTVFADTTPAVVTPNGKGTITISNAVKGEQYTVYHLFDAMANATTNAVVYGLPTTKNVADLTPYFELDAEGYVIACAGTTDTTVGSSGFKTWAENFGTKVGNTVTATANGELKFENLDYGYYYITSTQGAVISVDSLNPNATVRDKNTSNPVVPKNAKKILNSNGDTVSEISAAVGEDVNFEIKFDARNYDGTTLIEKYTIIDNPTNMTIKTDTVLVKVIENPDATDGSRKENTVTIDSGITASGLNFEIPWTESGASKYANKSQIVVTYTATVTAAAESGTASNQAKISWTGKTTPEEPDPTVVKTYNFTVQKVDGKNTNVQLEGAMFKLYSGETEIKVVAIDSTGSVISDINAQNVTIDHYRVATAEEAGFATDIRAGLMTIKGLKEGTYKLQETVAPEGYNKLTEKTREIAVGASSSENGVDIQVQNNQGTELPSTGGIGTTIFYIIGAILVIGAGVVLVTRRRMNVQ